MHNSDLKIGIYTRKEIIVIFHGEYKSNTQTYLGKHIFTENIILTPTVDNCYFELEAVTIGIDFHWQRNENQCFKGSLEIKQTNNNKFIAINHVNIEDYITSVISSEMSATSSIELLKAHAIISRTWALYNAKIAPHILKEKHKLDNTNKHIVWYDKDNHTEFELCADDHCQRYQGILRSSNQKITHAINETKSLVLTYQNKLCDARFYKCCGGATELYENCWDNTHYDYLCCITDNSEQPIIDLSIEENAKNWIMQPPKAYCDTTNKEILSQVLNNYDQETTDFYRWQIKYTQKELSDIIYSRSNIDFGQIIDLKPLKRGTSGRIYELQIIGSKQELIIGKELEIRKWLSNSHLYSSAFIVEKDSENNFTLYGAGWGHGVGLCQIGAAIMASKGFNYKQILDHYYPNTIITQYNV